MALLRTLRRRFGISARRMAVRPHIPWYWSALCWGAVAAAVAVWASNGLVGLAGDDGQGELASLRQTLERQEAELAEVRAGRTAIERQLQVERAAAGDLVKQVKSLTHENAALKEDLAFFQSLMTSPSSAGGSISVNRFQLQPQGTAGEYRYRMLLVQSGRRMREFQGTLQFVLDVDHGGRKLVLVVPGESERASRDYHLRFKFFQRVEGTFRLTPGSVLKGMQVRVFESGTKAPKLTQTLNVL